MASYGGRITVGRLTRLIAESEHIRRSREGREPHATEHAEGVCGLCSYTTNGARVITKESHPEVWEALQPPKSVPETGRKPGR